jgi:hypothetical protein
VPAATLAHICKSKSRPANHAINQSPKPPSAADFLVGSSNPVHRTAVWHIEHRVASLAESPKSRTCPPFSRLTCSTSCIEDQCHVPPNTYQKPWTSDREARRHAAVFSLYLKKSFPFWEMRPIYAYIATKRGRSPIDRRPGVAWMLRSPPRTTT